MKILVINNERALLWYTHPNYKRQETHVVCYGLEVKQFDSMQEAQAHYSACVKHSKACDGE